MAKNFSHRKKLYKKPEYTYGPALVEAVVHRRELSKPPTITAAQATGSGLFILKAVLSARGDEIVDLAKVNLFR